jgi:hypothetical protein
MALKAASRYPKNQDKNRFLTGASRHGYIENMRLSNQVLSFYLLVTFRHVCINFYSRTFRLSKLIKAQSLITSGSRAQWGSDCGVPLPWLLPPRMSIIFQQLYLRPFVYHLSAVTCGMSPFPTSSRLHKANMIDGATSGANALLFSLLLWYFVRRRFKKKRNLEELNVWRKAEIDTTALHNEGKTEPAPYEVHEMEGSAA